LVLFKINNFFTDVPNEVAKKEELVKRTKSSKKRMSKEVQKDTEKDSEEVFEKDSETDQIFKNIPQPMGPSNRPPYVCPVCLLPFRTRSRYLIKY
jgi:hypothetical protein